MVEGICGQRLGPQLLKRRAGFSNFCANEMIEIVQEAKATLPTGEFQNFWSGLNCPDYLLEEIESALDEG